MSNTLDLMVVTPARSLIHEKVDEVQVPGLGGYLGVLPGHAALFSELHVGELVYTLEGGTTRSIVVAKGFVEILEDEVRVLAGVAETPEEIDADRATQALERAEGLIEGGGEGVNYERAIAALERAKVRITVAKSARSANS